MKLSKEMLKESKLESIINLEGIDGTGKNTVSKELKTKLEAKGKKVFTLHFPVYDTPTGDIVKKYLTGDLIGDPAPADPIMSSLYYSVDRLTYYWNNMNIFTDYDVLIFDRSYMSNFFFQTAKYLQEHNISNEFYSNRFHLEEYLKLIRQYIQMMFVIEIKNSPLNAFLTRIKTFLLYHPNISTNFKLMEKRGGTQDMHESNKKFLMDIQENAFNMIKYKNEIYGPKLSLYPTQSAVYMYTPIMCSRTGIENLRNLDDICNEIIKHLTIKK